MISRQDELLRILLTNLNTIFQVDFLAESLHCSEKTVRNDLNHIEEYLVAYRTARLVRKPGLGLYLEIDEEDRSQLFNRLYQNQKDPMTEAERTIEIAYKLLVSNKPITLGDFAERYYTNKAEIKKDLAKIKSWFDRYDLSLVSKQRLGNIVSGSELNKRNALAHLSELLSSVTERNYILDLFPPYEVAAIRKALQNLQQKFEIVFTDGGFESLLIHALILIRRTRQQSPIAIPNKDKASTYQSNEYQMASWLLDQLETTFTISFSDNERIYYTWHLVSSRTRNDQPESLRHSDHVVADIVRMISERLQQLTMVNFEKDSILVEGLIIHLHAVINRITYGFTISNPLLPDIKKMYPYMFSMIVLALEDVKKKCDLEIPEDEAAYLVLHFQASIERLQKQRNLTKSVLIVCHLGIGMSHLLQAKLEQNYRGMNIVGCIGKMEVDAFLTTNMVDFIISTTPLDHMQVPYVEISPLLEANDKAKLTQFLQTMEKVKKQHQGNSSLVQLLDEETIHLGVDLEHRYEVVEMLANSLLARGVVSKTFVHHALLRERASATSIGGAIAIPHASPDTVKQSAIAMAIMKEPLEWGGEMVSIVFLLAIANENKMITKDLIQQISSISEQPIRVKELTESSSASDILSRMDRK
ncbi:BglG family transcription antiterminator [Virgibacillus ndiopensis]|uniref:BglG family transcription antiterminator n=1 Tax=Virgibacillus ndiopensis TaxID=2004408 RepID=UPI000C0760FD|nr:BglG family transcription antiterminator [Virgibacillus ndiopensis]